MIFRMEPIKESEIICDENHKYFIRGIAAPGVTEVLTGTGISYYPDNAVMERARERGKAVHKAIELHEKNTLEEKSLFDTTKMVEYHIAGYLDGYKRFKDDWIAKVLRYEKKVAHNIFRYCGTFDQVSVTLDGRLVVWDWKSGALPFWVELQTSAYLEALLTMEKLESDEVWHGAVQFCPDGTYKAPRLSIDRKAFGIFRQALNVYNYTDRKAA